MHGFNIGDAVIWTRYGKEYRGTIVQELTGGVAIIRDHETYSKTWAHCESLRHA